MDPFNITPIGSIFTRTAEATQGYRELTIELPIKVKDILGSETTASFVCGIARTYDIPEESQPSIAFAILELAIGKKTFAQIPGIFTSELGINPENAQKIASEIEKDIFGPIKGELTAFLQGQKGTRTTPPSSPSYEEEKSRARTATPTLRLAPLASTKPNNLLDLKEIAAAKRQEQLNAQPRQKQLPKRQLPPPLAPPRAGGETTTPTFPLPAKPAVSPIDFSTYQ